MESAVIIDKSAKVLSIGSEKTNFKIMNFYGFYAPEHKGYINIAGFIKKNIVGFCRLLKPGQEIIAIAADNSRLSRFSGHRVCVSYLPQTTVLELEEKHSAFVKAQNVFTVDSKMVKAEFDDSSDDLERMLILWRVVLESVRLFLQRRELKKNDFLPPLLIEEMCKRNLEYESLKKFLFEKFFVDGNATPDDLKKVTDMKIVGTLAAKLAGELLCQQGFFNFGDIESILRVRRSSFDLSLFEVLCL